MGKRKIYRVWYKTLNTEPLFPSALATSRKKEIKKLVALIQKQGCEVITITDEDLKGRK